MTRVSVEEPLPTSGPSPLSHADSLSVNFGHAVPSGVAWRSGNTPVSSLASATGVSRHKKKKHCSFYGSLIQTFSGRAGLGSGGG